MPAQPQQAHDRSTPESLIRAFYKAVSGPADHERDWDAIRELFHPSARIVITQAQPDGAPIGAFELEPFFEHAAAVYRGAGFWEREVWGRIDRFAGFAHVFSVYEIRVGSPTSEPIDRGVNSIQLALTDDGWVIVNVVSDSESEEHPARCRRNPDPRHRRADPPRRADRRCGARSTGAGFETIDALRRVVLREWCYVRSSAEGRARQAAAPCRFAQRQLRVRRSPPAAGARTARRFRVRVRRRARRAAA
jgi:hypothetical protein